MSIVDGGVGPAETSSDFLSIAQLLGNPSRLKAEYERLEAARKEAAAIVALVAPAKDIVRLKEEVRKASVEAASALVDARNRAQKLVDDAKARAAVITTEAERYAQEAAEQASEAMRTVAEVQKVAAQKVADAEKLSAQAKDAIERARAAHDRSVKVALDASTASTAEIVKTRKVRKTLEEAQKLLVEALGVGSP